MSFTLGESGALLELFERPGTHKGYDPNGLGIELLQPLAPAARAEMVASAQSGVAQPAGA